MPRRGGWGSPQGREAPRAVSEHGHPAPHTSSSPAETRRRLSFLTVAGQNVDVTRYATKRVGSPEDLFHITLLIKDAVLYRVQWTEDGHYSTSVRAHGMTRGQWIFMTALLSEVEAGDDAGVFRAAEEWGDRFGIGGVGLNLGREAPTEAVLLALHERLGAKIPPLSIRR